jgi:hypothetical protein
MATTSWLDAAFEEARQDFLKDLQNLPKSGRFSFPNLGTIDDVYKEIDRIQKEQAKTKSLVALRRIEPYLNGLKDYFGVVDTFAQIQPKITSLVWVRNNLDVSSLKIPLTSGRGF